MSSSPSGRGSSADLPARLPSRSLAATKRANHLVLDHLSLAQAIAHRHCPRRGDLDDMYQVAYLGLVKAAARFDPDVGHDFVGFAVPTIAGECKRHLRDHTWMVRPPRHIQELHLNARAVTDALAQQYGRQPTATEIAREIGTTVRSVREARLAGAGRHTVSVDAFGQRARDAHGSDIRAAHDLEAVEISDGIQRALSELSTSERQIVSMRFIDELTQSQIAAKTGATQMQVSRLLRKIVHQLRVALEPSLTAKAA